MKMIFGMLVLGLLTAGAQRPAWADAPPPEELAALVAKAKALYAQGASAAAERQQLALLIEQKFLADANATRAVKH